MMPFLRSLLALLALMSALTAAEPAAPAAPAPKKEEKKSEWVFSLLPKSLQKNPRIDLTVITEMTPLGKKFPEVTPAKPVYYITQSAGFNQRGHAPGNERTLKEADLERLLVR